jgi:hypothetical protein
VDGFPYLNKYLLSHFNILCGNGTIHIFILPALNTLEQSSMLIARIECSIYKPLASLERKEQQSAAKQ